MNIPSLPTDSLYKFMSLTGILLLVLIIGYFSNKIEQLKIKAVEINTEIELINLELKSLDKELARELNAVSKKFDPKLHNLSRINLFQAKSDIIHAKQIKLSGKIDILKIFNYELDKNQIIIFTGVPIILFFTLLNFRLWYVRVQKPLDEQLLKSMSVLSKPRYVFTRHAYKRLKLRGNIK